MRNRNIVKEVKGEKNEEKQKERRKNLMKIGDRKGR